MLDPTYFERKEYFEYLPLGFKMTKNVRGQMTNSKAIQTFKEGADSLKSGFDNAIILTIVSNFLLAGSIQIIWGLINTL